MTKSFNDSWEGIHRCPELLMSEGVPITQCSLVAGHPGKHRIHLTPHPTRPDTITVPYCGKEIVPGILCNLPIGHRPPHGVAQL